MKLFGYLNAAHERADQYYLISVSQSAGFYLETLGRSWDSRYSYNNPDIVLGPIEMSTSGFYFGSGEIYPVK